jgi:AraC-like DNA-binding protein
VMFTRRFGMSPGRWRQTHRNKQSSVARSRPKAVLA